MPTIKRFSSFTIYIYADDHAPPHFHVVGKGFKATVLISSLQIRRGRLPPKIWAEATAWAADHQDLLSSEWERYNGRD